MSSYYCHGGFRMIDWTNQEKTVSNTQVLWPVGLLDLSNPTCGEKKRTIQPWPYRHVAVTPFWCHIIPQLLKRPGKSRIWAAVNSLNRAEKLILVRAERWPFSSIQICLSALAVTSRWPHYTPVQPLPAVVFDLFCFFCSHLVFLPSNTFFPVGLFTVNHSLYVPSGHRPTRIPCA